MIKVFKGKRVAFVGMAPILEGKGLGKEIDRFDAVYRTNFLPQNKQDFGSKCSVISVLKDHFNLMYTHKNVKNVVLFDDIDLHKREKYLVTEQERRDIRAKYIAEYGLDIRDATAGLVAYYLATKYKAKSFKFYGVTGYQNLEGEIVNHSGNNHYTQEIFDVLGGREFSLSVDMKNYDCHDFQAHNDLFRIFLKNQMIEMDQYSLEYFKIK